MIIVCIAFESSVKKKLDLNPETSFYYNVKQQLENQRFAKCIYLKKIVADVTLLDVTSLLVNHGILANGKGSVRLTSHNVQKSCL